MAFSFINEISLANASEGGGVIVILSERKKMELEVEIASHFHETGLRGTKIVIATGNPVLLSDIKRVSPHLARSITIMNSEKDGADSDTTVLRIILTLKSLSDVRS